MNKLEQAARQALEALESVTPACELFHHIKKEQHLEEEICKPYVRYKEAITAIRKALNTRSSSTHSDAEYSEVAQPQGMYKTEIQAANQTRNAILEYLVDSGTLDEDGDIYKTIAAQPLDQILVKGETQMTNPEIAHRHDCGNNSFDCAGCESAYWRDLQNQSVKKDFQQIGWGYINMAGLVDVVRNEEEIPPNAFPIFADADLVQASRNVILELTK